METTQTTPRTLEHLLPLAQRAYNWTSFSPERRGESVVNDYSAELDADIESIRTEAAKNEEITPEAIDSTVERYKAKYESLLKAYLHSHSNVASAMITGPARFPTARNQKRSNWADGHYNTFRTYRERAMKAILKSFKKHVDPLEAYRKDLAQREAAQVFYVNANKAIRKYKNNIPALIAECAKYGISEAHALKMLEPDFCGRIGVPSYKLTNNNANIKRIKSRIAELEKRAVTETITVEANGGVTINDNAQDNRIQILFPDKPSAECRAELKSSGFRWAPSNSAWQSYRNQRNYDTAKAIVAKYYPA